MKNFGLYKGILLFYSFIKLGVFLWATDDDTYIYTIPSLLSGVCAFILIYSAVIKKIYLFITISVIGISLIIMSIAIMFYTLGDYFNMSDSGLDLMVAFFWILYITDVIDDAKKSGSS